MKEMNNMKEVFDIFVDSCEKAGVKFINEEEEQVKQKQVEEWPQLGDVVFLEDHNGDCRSYMWQSDMKRKRCFKTRESYEKYYSIIDTINKIVDELGRPSWEDFENMVSPLHTIFYTADLKTFAAVNSCTCFESVNIFPWCKESYLDTILEKVSEEDLLWAFKKSMRLV